MIDPGVRASAPVWRYRSPTAVADQALPATWGDPSAPLVYVSFGSVTGSQERFGEIYPAMLACLADLPIRVLMTTGNGYDPSRLHPLPTNAWATRWWPQEAVMPVARLAIGHGGFGTTMTALASGVPQLVMPLFAADQYINAQRIQSVGAGLQLVNGTDSVDDVPAAVDRATRPVDATPKPRRPSPPRSLRCPTWRAWCRFFATRPTPSRDNLTGVDISLTLYKYAYAMSKTVTRSSWRDARRRDASAVLVSTAWEIVREVGLGGLSLRDLARRAGVTTPTVYAYFESKYAIYDAMFKEAAESFAQSKAEPIEGSDPHTTLVIDVQRFVDFCTSDVPRYQLLFQHLLPGFVPSPEAYAPAVLALELSQQRLADNGVTDPAHWDIWTAMTTGLVDQQIANDPGGDRWSRLIDQVVAMLLAHSAPTKRRTSDA